MPDGASVPWFGTSERPAQVATPSSSPTVAWHRAVEEVLEEPGQRLTMAYQPVIDLRQATVVGYSALARFAGPPEAPPDRWFAMAHAEGLGARLEALVVERVLGARPSLPANTFLALHIGAAALGSRPVQTALRAGGELQGVVVEITDVERVDDDHLKRAIAALRRTGASVALDDAGTGLVGLQRILGLRPQVVKLERSLVVGLDGDEARGAVVETMATFTRRLDAWLVAEGVEREADLDALLRLGVRLAQGYLLGRPGLGWGQLDEGVARHIRSRSARDDA